MSLSASLSDAHCRVVVYRGLHVLRCDLCGHIISAVLAHFEAAHRDVYAEAGGRL